MAKVRNDLSVETAPGYGGIWKPGEVRDVPEGEAERLVRIAGFSAFAGGSASTPDDTSAGESNDADEYVCADCPKVFKTLKGMKSHEKNKHGVTA